MQELTSHCPTPDTFNADGTKQAVDQGVDIFPSSSHRKLTMGVPFYARNVQTGDWSTYEDIVQKHHPLDPAADEVTEAGTGHKHYFNGVETMKTKVDYAFKAGIGGVMIWEGGQDCRMVEIAHDDRPGERHVANCPRGKDSSLLNAIKERIEANEAVDEL